MSDPIMAETEQMALVLAGEAAAEPNIPIAVLLERSAKAYGTTAGRMKYALTFAKVRGLVTVDYDSATVEGTDHV